MARATAPDERIAIGIDTSYDGSGIRAARQDNGALARETRAAAQELAGAGQTGAAANRGLASAAREAAEAQGKVFITAEQSNAMWKKAGGDFSIFNQLVRQHVGEQRALAVVTASTTSKLQEMAAAGQTGVVANRGLAGAAREATVEQQKLSVSAETMREILAKSGGDFTKTKQLLSQYVAEQKALAAATAAATAELQKQTTAGSGGSSAAQQSVRRVREEVDRISPRARTAANAVSMMTLSFQQGAGSAHGLATAAGTAAFGLSTLTSNARLAASAAGVGALVTVLATLILFFQRARAEGKATEIALGHIGRLSLGQLGTAVDIQRKRVEDAAKATMVAHDLTAPAERISPLSRYGKALKAEQAERDELNKLLAKRDEMEQDHRVQVQEQLHSTGLQLSQTRRGLELEAMRTIQLRQQTGIYQTTLGTMEKQRAMLVSEHEMRRRQLETEHKAREEAIREQFRQVDGEGHLVKLTAEQEQKLAELLKANKQLTAEKREQLTLEESLASATARISRQMMRADLDRDLKAGYDARLAQIELERKAELAKTGDIAAANEHAELKIRQLRRETWNQTKSALGTLAQATIDSQNSTIRALGKGAETLRRLMIGAEAALAAVESARHFGLATGALAMGNLAGAGLHTLAGIQLAAAAALGARESLGGGGSSAGAGGGSVSGPALSTNDPREAGGNVTVIIQTVNPFSKEVLGETSYQLQRAGVLKQPIYAPATSGAYVMNN